MSSPGSLVENLFPTLSPTFLSGSTKINDSKPAPSRTLHLLGENGPSDFLAKAAALFGHFPDDRQKEDIVAALVHPDDHALLQQYQAQLNNAKAGSDLQQIELRLRRPDGMWGYLYSQLSVVSRDPDGKPCQIIALLCDISETRDREERLRLLESVVVNANDVVLITEAEPIDFPGPRVLYVNDAFTRMTGYTPSEIIGKTPRILQGPNTSPETRQFIRNKLKNWEGFRAELLNYKKDGTQFWVELNVQPVADENGWFTHWIAIQRETTERREMENERKRQLTEALNWAERERLLAEALDRADRDPLTNLLNHRAFHERLMRETQNANAGRALLAVAVFDLDNFKFFNDAYGHLTGDDVLRRLAAALQTECRDEDILARLGGDEFGLLLTCQKQSDIQAIVERLRSAVSGIGYCPPGYNTPIPLSVSCGVALYPDDGGTGLAVLKTADERLMRDKVGNQDYQVERLRDELKRTVTGFAMLDALVTAVDNKDRYTRRHSEDVMLHSVALARDLELDQASIHRLQVAALLHDVGKIGVPDRLLRLPSRLTDKEYDVVKQHAAMGAVMVSSVPNLADIVEAVHFHHERWNGGGYPNGLQGEEIPLLARILAVADAYSAMTTDRPYRKGMTHEEAMRVLEEGAGEQWEPYCVGAFLRSFATTRDKVEAGRKV